MEIADVERALDALEGDGARQFDAPSCDCVRTLLTRAEELGGEAARLLGDRAAVHVERLRTRFTAARAEAEALLEASEARHGPQPALREALGRGDVVRVRRTLRRLATQPPRVSIARKPAPTPAMPEGSARYEDSLAELVASFALARAVDVVPEDAGPYNPLRIASELLGRMRTVSPLYLTAQLNRLEELASLLELPELPGSPSRPAARKKKRALKKG